MKKIITALANPELANEIKKTQKYEMIFPDIQYQEGVLEIFENNKEADFLILNSIIPGQFGVKTFIKKIKQKNSDIEIIIILEKEDQEMENFLISQGVFKKIYNNQITIEELINYIEQDIKENKLNEEIKILKKIILKNDLINQRDNNKTNQKQKNNKKIIKIVKKITAKIIVFLKNKLKIENKKPQKINKNKLGNKIILISGTANSGKSILSIVLSELIKNKKILIIDLNFENSSINTMFQIKKKTKEYNINIKNKIIKINNKINLFCLNEIFLEKNNSKSNLNESNDRNTYNKINIKMFNKFINEIKDQYDYIFIDTSSEIPYQINKIIEEIVDYIFFISEANISQLKKSKILLEKYINKYQIKKEKIKIIINKYNNKKSIDKNILKKIFMDFQILSYIRNNSDYEFLLNNNNLLKNIKNINQKIKKEYYKIIEYLNLE